VRLSARLIDLARQFRRKLRAGRLDKRARRLVPQIGSAAALFAAAKSLSDDVEIDRAVLDYVYARRTSSTLSRADWEAAVRHATAVFFMLRSPPKGFPWSKLVEPKTIDRAFRTSARHAADHLSRRVLENWRQVIFAPCCRRHHSRSRSNTGDPRNIVIFRRWQNSSQRRRKATPELPDFRRAACARDDGASA
jgi:hypothetical protein